MRQDEKMFVTDIDGTITKSDMSGFLLPKLGVDHHHSGTPYSHLCIQFPVSLIYCCEKNFRCSQIPQRDRRQRIQGHLFDCTALGFGWGHKGLFDGKVKLQQAYFLAILTSWPTYDYAEKFEFFPLVLSFFLEFWVFSLSFKFFLEFWVFLLSSDDFALEFWLFFMSFLCKMISIFHL